MKRISKKDRPLLQQFKRWARSLLEVNPGYVKRPTRLQSYIQGPNWNDAGVEYAHYMTTISLYGDELLEMFKRMRAAKWGEGLEEYRGLLSEAGIEESNE